ncbi:MAG: [FeFe] hydrogenase H-cluster radical SAM maturase HydE [Eubacteriales bacterium]|nr:[FeFe] hydrogenase H-cluster radical SAM maturase HydE [Eubacteriales bacterium]MDY3332428.1 [FeFe] hydrogenase H-cluster radical SAM maturase HydE [Gallibacter sp.]
MQDKNLIKQLYEGQQLDKDSFIELLSSKEKYEEEAFFYALKKREEIYARSVYFRALIEISSYCRRDCYYCGLRVSNNKAQRYRLNKEEILDSVNQAYYLGFRTIVMQGGEDPIQCDDFVIDVVNTIKSQYNDIAVTLSLGEKSYESYKKMREAGADRYLLRHETADLNHYEKLHPNSMSGNDRKKCIYTLKELGYQVGAGMMIGSPYQTIENIASDLMFIQELKPQMVGLGPFIHHRDTPFANFSNGKPDFTYYVLSLVRLVNHNVLLPITTALSTLDEYALERGLQAGGNVIMPNISPEEKRKKYAIYNDKKDYKVTQENNLEKLKERIRKVGFIPDMQIGNYKEDLYV